MEVILAKSAGFCYGVRRAVDLARETAQKRGGCWMLGDLIHNAHVIEELSALGVRRTSEPGDLRAGDVVVVRSHGERKSVLDALTARGVECVDATCPNVRRIQQIVAEAEAGGRQAVIIGEPNHPEVTGVASWCRRPLVLEGPGAVRDWMEKTPGFREIPLTVVAQTTCIREIFENSWKILKKECTDAKKYDTICNATQRRQTEATEIAARAGVMVVVGDRKSANTRHLAEICRDFCPRVVQIETAAELSRDLFAGYAVAGLTAGASTPAGIIKEVFATMSEEFTNEAVTGSTESVTEEPATPATAEETATTAVAEEPETPAPAQAVESAKEEPANEFEEMLNKQSFRTLNTGEKVTGIVRAITTKEVEVDVGAKQTAYIKFSELSDDPNANPEDIVHVGDEIEAYIVRVNDVEGFAELSKRRLDAQKKWEEVEKAVEDKTIHEGVVTEENKGGIVVLVDGIRVFVPASQSGKPRGADLSAMRGQTVRLRITEFNKARRRVVGSIRAVQDEERRAAQDKVWSSIEVGKRYSGVVKSMTSYGVFVDIGGVDGMVHISELSWSRIKDPREVCKVGDPLDVYVISFDPERRKISLGVKDHNIDPWQEFLKKYNVGKVVPVRIVKLMPFGAFAEVVPGVDGLIHISQIADHRVEKPEDELSEGQTVNAKITNIDEERQKISLSIRQARYEDDAE